jgi:hypothetical protein
MDVRNIFSTVLACVIVCGLFGQVLAQPANNTCLTATVINQVPYTDSGSTATATNTRWNCVGGDSPDVWYWYNPPCDGAITISLCGSGYDTGLEILEYAGVPCYQSEISMYCNDDSCGLQSGITIPVYGESAIWIVVHGYSTASGPYTINVTGNFHGPSFLDTCDGRSISSLPFTDYGNTACMNADYSISCLPSNSPDVIYRLQMDSCRTVTASLCGSGFDTAIEIRKGGACPGNTVVACNDDYCGFQSQVVFDGDAGEVYYLLVRGYNFASLGPYVLNVTATSAALPANDDCPGNSVVNLPYVDYGDLTCALGSINDCISNTVQDVWYSFTFPQDMELDILALKSSAEAWMIQVEVRMGGPCPGNTVIGCAAFADSASLNPIRSMMIVRERTFPRFLSRNPATRRWRHKSHLCARPQTIITTLSIVIFRRAASKFGSLSAVRASIPIGRSTRARAQTRH